jgi:hypothetical protein
MLLTRAYGACVLSLTHHARVGRGECIRTNYTYALNEDCASPNSTVLTYDAANPSSCNGIRDITCADVSARTAGWLEAGETS